MQLLLYTHGFCIHGLNECRLNCRLKFLFETCCIGTEHIQMFSPIIIP
jgi:hypothetical protein